MSSRLPRPPIEWPAHVIRLAHSLMALEAEAESGCNPLRGEMIRARIRQLTAEMETMKQMVVAAEAPAAPTPCRPVS